MASSYFVTYGTDRLTFGGLAGSLAYAHEEASTCNVSLFTDNAITTAYITASYNGQTTSWYATTSVKTKEVPRGAALYIQASTPTYYRQSGISSNILSNYESGVVSTGTSFSAAYGKFVSASGILSDNGSVTTNNTQLNTFTAKGKTQSAINNNSERWEPFIVTGISAAYDFLPSISASYAVRAKSGSYEVAVPEAIHLKSGVPFSSFSGRFSTNLQHDSNGKTQSATASAGVSVCGVSSYSTYTFRGNQAGIVVGSQTVTSASLTLSSGFGLNKNMYAIGKMSWGGTVTSMNVYGFWTASGIAP